VSQLLPVYGNDCDRFEVGAACSPNLLQLLPVGGNNCDSFEVDAARRRANRTIRCPSGQQIVLSGQ